MFYIVIFNSNLKRKSKISGVFSSYKKAEEFKNNLVKNYIEVEIFNSNIHKEAKSQAAKAVIDYFKNNPLTKYEHISPDFNSSNYLSEMAASMANGYAKRFEFEDRLFNIKQIQNKTYNEYYTANKKEYEHGEGTYEIIEKELDE